MEIRHYTVAMLERELRDLEERYGMSSEAFFEIYRVFEVPSNMPGREGFRWADTYSELCRLRGAVDA